MSVIIAWPCVSVRLDVLGLPCVPAVLRNDVHRRHGFFTRYTASRLHLTTSSNSTHADRGPLSPSLAPPSIPNSSTFFTPQRPRQTGPLNSIPTSHVQHTSAHLACRQPASRYPIIPQTAKEWSNIVHSLSDTHTNASDKASQLLCLASSLQRVPESELEALTAAPSSLAAFLNIAGGNRSTQDSSLHAEIAESFLHPLLQDAVASTGLLSSAADAIIAAATRACADSYWHPEAVAAAAHLQLVFCRGHRTFWNLLSHNSDCLHECDARSFAHIAECAAALRVQHLTLWTPLAASTNNLALHMSTGDLHACSHALGATFPVHRTPQTLTGTPLATPASPARLDSLLEVLQWRSGQGGFEAAELPYTALSVATILSQTLPGADERPSLVDATHMSELAPGFWREMVLQSRTVCRDGYGSRDAFTMAVACMLAEQYFEARLSAERWSAGSGDEAEGGDSGGPSIADSHAAVAAHKQEMFRFAALAAVADGGSADGEDRDITGEIEEGYRVECMQAWLEVLVGCATARVSLGMDVLSGAARVVHAMYGVDALNVGLAVAALAGCAAVDIRQTGEQHRQGIAAMLHATLADAAARDTCMGPMHAIEVLQIITRDVPEAAGTGESREAVLAWLLGQVKGQVGGLSEHWLTRYLSAVAALPGVLTGLEGLHEELRACLQSRTFSPRDSYDFSEVVNREFFADVRHELAPEREGFTTQWRSAHGRHAAGFTPSEAAEAARCVKALRLFDGGSSVLEALLAVSMGGATDAAPAVRGAAEGGLWAAFQGTVSDAVDSLGGKAICWMPDGTGDDELLATNGAEVSEITRQCSGVYSALALGGVGRMGQGGGVVGGAGERGGCYVFEGSFDGAAAEKVAEVMHRTEAGLAEVTDALERADWDADVAGEMLILEREAPEEAAAE